jgi:pimeloyl-ACP methyl ester carboxylesterase
MNRDSVVLLHSSASSARQWDALAALLRPRFEVHAIDLHGHGLQPAWGGPGALTLADEAALAAPVFAHAERVHIIAHSYGAAVALELASLHPHRVASLVAYEPVLFRWLLDDQRHEAASAAPARDVLALAAAIDDGVARDDPAAAARVFVDFWSGDGAWAALPASRQASVAARMGAVRRHFGAVFREPRSAFAGVHADTPMLFQCGARSPAATRRIATLLRAAWPQARHETLPALGHMGPLTDAAAFNARVLRFLDALPLQLEAMGAVA